MYLRYIFKVVQHCDGTTEKNIRLTIKDTFSFQFSLFEMHLEQIRLTLVNDDVWYLKPKRYIMSA